MIKKCVECGAEFSAPPSSKKITCSKSCSSRRRSRLLTGHITSDHVRQQNSMFAKKRGFTENLKKGTAAAMHSEKGGRNELNSSAKTFVIISPDSKLFKVTNLRHWIRNNIDLFDCTLTDENVDRIANGFYTIKRNIKFDRRGKTYKGWTIEDWDDRKNFEKQKTAKE